MKTRDLPLETKLIVTVLLSALVLVTINYYKDWDLFKSEEPVIIHILSPTSSIIQHSTDYFII